MVDQTLIADLIRAGIDPDLVNRVALEIQSASVRTESGGRIVDSKADKRKAWDRQRQAAKRKALKKLTDSGGTAGPKMADPHGVESAIRPPDNPPDSAKITTESFFLSSSVDESAKKESKKDRSISARERNRGSRMHPDAVLDDAYRDIALTMGVPANEIPEWFDEFRDYWLGVAGEKGVKNDWPATWRNHIRKQRKWNHGKFSNGHGSKSSGPIGQDAAIIAGVGRLARRNAERRAAEGQGREVEDREDDPRGPYPRLV